jgi:hypothetical protein
LAELAPDDDFWQRDRADAAGQLGTLLLRRGDRAGALDAARDCAAATVKTHADPRDELAKDVAAECRQLDDAGARR